MSRTLVTPVPDRLELETDKLKARKHSTYRAQPEIRYYSVFSIIRAATDALIVNTGRFT